MPKAASTVMKTEPAFRKRSSNGGGGGGDLKTPAFRFCVDGKHVKNEPFRNLWRLIVM